MGFYELRFPWFLFHCLVAFSRYKKAFRPHFLRHSPCEFSLMLRATDSTQTLFNFFCNLKHLRSPLFPSHNEYIVFLYASLIWCVRRKNTCSPVVMAEWLRRWTRNPMGYSLTGSNPVHDENTFLFLNNFSIIFNVY